MRFSRGAWCGLAILTAAFLYLWILPLFRPRGAFLWGYYRLKDVYLGIPVALGLACTVTVLAAPARLRRPLALRLASVSISLVLAIFVCDAIYALAVNRAWEGNFWLDQAHIPRRYSAPDDELGFVRKPGASWRGFVPDANRTVDYRTDERGFRNPDGLSRADVVFIGDSFTEAATVAEHDTFVRQVGTISGLTVVNLGRGAYGPQQASMVLQRYGLAYRPRVVVWQLFEGNDLLDASQFAEWKKNPHQGGVSFPERYFNNSLLGQLPRSAPSAPPLVRIRRSDGTDIHTTLRYPYDPAAPARHAVGLAGTAEAIERAHRLCRSRGISLLVLFVPTMVRVMAPYLSFDRPEDKARYLPDDSGDARDDFSARIGRLCATLGCEFIDTFAALRQAAATDSRDLYIPANEHLDVHGHTVVAHTVVDWMRSRVSPARE